MSAPVVVTSASLAEDAAYQGPMADAVAAADRAGVEYRIMGGQMVTVQVATAPPATPHE